MRIDDNVSYSEMLTRWNEVLDDMCGEDLVRKNAIVDVAIPDENVSSDAKKGLRSLLKE